MEKPAPTLKSARSLQEIVDHMSTKQASIRALAGFIIPGRPPAEAGEILTVSESFARELIHTHKAERFVPPPVVVEHRDPIPVPAVEVQEPRGKHRAGQS